MSAFPAILPPSDSRSRSQYFEGPTQLNFLRDSLTISTWVSLGASLQCILLLLLPLRLAIIPPIFYLLSRILDTILVWHGVRPNSQMDGVLPGKTSAQFPDSTGPSEQPIVVIKLAMRSNHPLGVLHRHMRIVGKMFDRMMDELDNNSDHYEYLGANRYIANERATSNEIMILAYFRSYEGLHKFSHNPDGVHREAWNYWNKEIMGKGKTEEGRMFGINHEVFQAPARRWESIYANYHPSGLGAATFKVAVDGKDKWANPLVDASRGLLRTSQGRMAVTAGDENEVYGEDPYVNGNDKI